MMPAAFASLMNVKFGGLLKHRIMAAKFHDLNIRRSRDIVALKHTLKLALRFGYGVVAVNTVVEDGAKIPPAPPPVDLGLTPEEGEKFKQLSRVTVVLDDKTDKIFMRNENIKSYDILAVRPTTEKSWLMACRDLNVDLISVDLSQFLGYHLKHHEIQTVKHTGKYFEICYAPAIRDASCRKLFFRNTLDLIDKRAAKNTIISSGAEMPFNLRGPYDIANLALLFGMNEKQAKDSLTTLCKSVHLKARTRSQTVKSALTVRYLKDIPEKEKWKLKGLVSAEEPPGKEKKRELEEGTPERGNRSKKLKAK